MTDTAPPGTLPWRTGRKVGRTVYDARDRLIGVLDTPELADQAVRAANADRPAADAEADDTAERGRIYRDGVRTGHGDALAWLSGTMLGARGTEQEALLRAWNGLSAHLRAITPDA